MLLAYVRASTKNKLFSKSHEQKEDVQTSPASFDWRSTLSFARNLVHKRLKNVNLKVIFSLKVYFWGIKKRLKNAKNQLNLD